MKTIQISDTEIEQAENADDLPIQRYIAIKEQIIYKASGMDIPSIVKTFESVIKQFDNESRSGMLIALYDFINGLKKVQSGDDPDQMIFALMTFEKDENKHNADTTKLKEKLKRYAELGLLQKQVREATENFIKASPTLSTIFIPTSSIPGMPKLSTQ